MHSINNPYNFKENTFIKVNGKIIKEMAEVCNNGKMALYIKVIGKIISLMDMEGLFMLMETYT